MDDMKKKIDQINKELEKCGLDFFYIYQFSFGGNLIIAGSFDFSYYHNIELSFANASFILCPTEGFKVNKILISSEKQKLKKHMKGFENEGYVFCLKTDSGDFFIVADDINLKDKQVMY